MGPRAPWAAWARSGPRVSKLVPFTLGVHMICRPFTRHPPASGPMGPIDRNNNNIVQAECPDPFISILTHKLRHYFMGTGSCWTPCPPGQAPSAAWSFVRPSVCPSSRTPCGAPTGGLYPVFSATALQDPGLQLVAPPRLHSLPWAGLVRSRLPPGSFPACSPWLLGLWPELLWLSRASAWSAWPFAFVRFCSLWLPGSSSARSPWVGLLGLFFIFVQGGWRHVCFA